MKDEYHKLLLESNLFFPGASRGSFIFPPNGLKLWQNIQGILDRKFARHGVQNVALPTLIPLNLLEKEKEHISGFNPECFYIEKIGEKKIDVPLILRPTSEVLFYEWYRRILQSYQQLPFLYNQWCQVFRAEKNTKPFLRNTEFFWQEGHTLHETAEEAQEFAQKIWREYQDYAEKNLCLAIIAGKKSKNEKFAGALESYTVECLLPDGQCLQLATSHFFGDNFCQAMNVEFQNKQNQLQHPFSTSWGTSTRAIGAIAGTHNDKWGIILPFDVAPVQIAFILIEQNKELISYYQEINSLLDNIYRCQLYNKSPRVNLNILQADKEGCPLKIILGAEELKKREVTLVRRDNVERRITISLESSESEKNFLHNLENKSETQLVVNHEKVVNSVKIELKRDKIHRTISREIAELKKNIYQKAADFCNNHIFPVDNFSELSDKIKKETKGLFLIPFCNRPKCETTIPSLIPSYSIRCIKEKIEASDKKEKCIFCSSQSQEQAFLGRSY